MADYKEKRIAPRAENLLKHVNDSILYNLRRGGEDTVLLIPPRISRAYMIVNETGTLTVQDFRSNTVFIQEQ